MERSLLEQTADRLADIAVVDGAPQVAAPPRVLQVGVQLEIDRESLALAALLFGDADVAHADDVAERQTILVPARSAARRRSSRRAVAIHLPSARRAAASRRPRAEA